HSDVVPSQHLSASGQSPIQQPWAKRLITNAARRVKDSSLFFPGIVCSFRALQKLGINLTPNHFYWPVPDVEELARREWPIYSAPPGCDFRLGEQVKLASDFSKHYVRELNWDSRPTADS